MKKQRLERDPKDPGSLKSTIWRQCKLKRADDTTKASAVSGAECIFPAHFMLHMIDKNSATPVAPAVVAQLEITSSGSVTAAAAAAAEGGADMPTR